MKILRYNELEASGLAEHVNRAEQFLKEGNFRAADVKKMVGTAFYRARLTDADRLLFRFARCGGETVLLLLEVIRNHAYATSRFLNGAVVDESKIQPVDSPEAAAAEDAASLVYLNSRLRHFHVLDRILSFDDAQDQVFALNPPVILIGSAGSGKTVLTLEKLKQLSGDILYVTLSPHLAENARNLYYAHGYENDAQNVDFLSYGEFLESIQMPPGREVTFRSFAARFSRSDLPLVLRDTHQVYEEIHGVLTGSSVDAPYLSREDYLALGVRQSIFLGEERNVVYGLFEKYLRFLREENLYNSNLVAHRYLQHVAPSYDFLVADEVQDLTRVQLALALKTLRTEEHFILCGDANQIVHPNFFSWAQLKSFFYDRRAAGRAEILRVLDANYRNSPQVVALANRLLQIKNARFGSIDRESNYLVRPVSQIPGLVELFADGDSVRRDLNAKTCRSARVAVIVMREEDKAEARRQFQTPLVFTIQEAKGLEYDTAILLNFVSAHRREYDAIVEGVEFDHLQNDDLRYARAKDKSDKSLEAYKFFVNSLYVAMTRAIRNLHWIEQNPTHRIFGLLGLAEKREASQARSEASSQDEWKEEARRLERQGKKDQADEIRRTILAQKEVPWNVLTPKNLDGLKKDALDPANFNRQAKLQLFEYAVIHDVPYLLNDLANLNFKAALSAKSHLDSIQTKYHAAYRSKNFKEIRQKIDLYGIDFRNPLNQTPLMIAAEFGMVDLVEWLIANGANLRLTDNWGRNPLQIALLQAFREKSFASDVIGQIYGHLAPPCLKVKVQDRLVKIDATRMEYFLLHSMIAILQVIVRVKGQWRMAAFETGDFIWTLSHFPDHVIAPHRKARPYISSILSKNEIHRQDPLNRKLFMRVQYGKYVINPTLEVELDDSWVNVYDLIHIDELAGKNEDAHVRQFAQYILARRKEGAQLYENIHQDFW